MGGKLGLEGLESLACPLHEDIGITRLLHRGKGCEDDLGVAFLDE